MLCPTSTPIVIPSNWESEDGKVKLHLVSRSENGVIVAEKSVIGDDGVVHNYTIPSFFDDEGLRRFYRPITMDEYAGVKEYGKRFGFVFKLPIKDADEEEEPPKWGRDTFGGRY